MLIYNKYTALSSVFWLAKPYCEMVLNDQNQNSESQINVNKRNAIETKKINYEL